MSREADQDYIEEFIKKDGVVDIEFSWKPFIHLVSDWHMGELAGKLKQIEANR